ncbi:hypothetical protein FHR21_001150 [Sphingopyxis panaciterrulae]|uniref:Uncharacterized protein n=1 Tax=Sphingopyxis panaciterrulae TaxID=462372 RepID=A0A7W9B4H1_9SPHN|nr:hypothetical protein [Sphingopyxis panaciterrulae]
MGSGVQREVVTGSKSIVAPDQVGNYTLGIRKPPYFVIATPAKAGGSNPERFARTLDCFAPLAMTGLRMRKG